MVLLAAGLALGGVGTAQAQWPYAFPNNLGPTAFGVTGTMYGLGLVPVPPYYALHPPVYYSFPVPRSYGYSPFAYPGCMQTPEVDMFSFPQGDAGNSSEPKQEELPPAKPTSNVASRGLWVENPFLKGQAPGVVVNPFVQPQDEIAPLVASARSHESDR